MWFECLPSFAIICGAMALPHIASYAMNYVVLGNLYRRDLLGETRRVQYLRDIRVSGDAYVVNGLDCIPDEEE